MENGQIQRTALRSHELDHARGDGARRQGAARKTEGAKQRDAGGGRLTFGAKDYFSPSRKTGYDAPFVRAAA